MREVERALANMTATVKEQMTDALASFHDRDLSEADGVVERDDIVDNLYGALEERIFEAIGAAGANISESRRWRAALRVLSNLERIGDAAAHIAKHAIMMSNEPAPAIDFSDRRPGRRSPSNRSAEGVDAFIKQDLELAKSACERERELDELYVKKLHQVMQLLDKGEGHARYLLHVLGGDEVPGEDGGLRAEHRRGGVLRRHRHAAQVPAVQAARNAAQRGRPRAAPSSTATSGTASRAPSCWRSTAPTATAISSKKARGGRSRTRSAAASNGRTWRRCTRRGSSARRRTKSGAPCCASSPMARCCRTSCSSPDNDETKFAAMQGASPRR